MQRIRLRSFQGEPLNIWPGFVDALSALVLVLLFTFMLFILMQFHLSDKLNTRDRSLTDLQHVIASLRKSLHLTHTQKEKLLQEKDQLHQASTTKIVELNILKQEIEQLNARLQDLSETLGISEQKLRERDEAITDLSFKLDKTLKERMKELSEYRSEFFGNLKKILGERDDIRVVGDRFIFQSEVLFTLGSDQIGEEGQKRLRHLASALKEIAHKIPVNTHWILRVDGHTDRLPIKSATFPSNWELSTARALAVVKFLIEEGLPPQHLVAAGLGEFHPLDSGETPEALARNRRIEFKLDQR